MQDVTNLGVMVLNAGTFSDADLSGSWAFAHADGISGSLTFDGKGDVTAGTGSATRTAPPARFLSGSNYTVTSGGLVTMTIYNTNKAARHGRRRSSHGALNASETCLPARGEPDDLTARRW